MRMVLSHRFGRVDEACNLRGHVNGYLSDVLVSITLVFADKDLVACGNRIFFPEASSAYFGSCLVLGNHRMDALSVYSWFSLVSVVSDAMGTSCDSSGCSLSWCMGRILLPAGFQFVPRFLFASPFSSST